MTPILTIANQYQGVNAYLHSLFQTEGGWESFHTLHIGDLTKALNAQLNPLGYEVDIEQSLQVKRMGEPPSYPESDITVYDTSPTRRYQRSFAPQTGNTLDVIMPIPTLLNLSEEEIEYYKAIGLYRAVPNRRARGEAVAWVELLSPSNKPSGRHFESYRDKRTQVIQSGVVFIEIDYLHHYPPTFDALASYQPRIKHAQPERGSHPYRITVVEPRPDFFEGQAHLRQFDVDDPIPTMTIPLSAGDFVEFDFGMPYKKTFEEMRYGNKVDYSQFPPSFDRYSDDDKVRVACRMLAVLEAAKNGIDLEHAAPLASKKLSLDDALAQVKALL